MKKIAVRPHWAKKSEEVSDESEIPVAEEHEVSTPLAEQNNKVSDSEALKQYRRAYLDDELDYQPTLLASGTQHGANFPLVETSGGQRIASAGELCHQL